MLFFHNSRIVVTLNVNHTVDSSEPDDGSEEAPEMKSMPNFEVDIVKSDGRTLSFSCSYLSPDDEPPSRCEYSAKKLKTILKLKKYSKTFHHSEHRFFF